MSGKKRSDYISQNENTCEDALWAGCGLVSLVNSLLFMDITSRSSREVHIWRCYKIGQDLELFDESGLSPAGLKTLCAKVCRTWGLTVTLHETCDDSDLCPGMLLFVSSVALLNAQDCGEQFEQEDVNSHIVMLESVQEAGLVVINPDRRIRKRGGGGFIEGKWGRMFIPVSSVTQVWQCVHQLGTTTTRCAISIRHRDSCIWYRHDPLLGMNPGMVCTCFLKEDCECAPIRQLVIRELKDRADALDNGVSAAGYEWIHSNVFVGGESLLHERCECSSKRNEVIHMLYHRITLRDNNLFVNRLPRIRKEFGRKARKEYAALRASELAKSCSSSLDLSMSYKSSSDSDSAFDCKECASNTSAMESTYSAMGRIGGEVTRLKRIGNATTIDSNDVTKTMEQLVAENVELKSKMRLMTEKICSIEDICDEQIDYYIRELHFK